MTEELPYDDPNEKKSKFCCVLLIVLIVFASGYGINEGIKYQKEKDNQSKYQYSFITIIYSKEIKPSDGYSIFILNCANNTEYTCESSIYFSIEINRTVRIFYDKYGMDHKIYEYSYNLTNPYEG